MSQSVLFSVAGWILASMFPFSSPSNVSKAPNAEIAVCSSPCFSGSRVSRTLTPSLDTAVGDFNNDGRLDIVTKGTFSGGPLAIQFGIGNGLFGDAQIVDPQVNQASLLAGDFNNDGKTDLFVPTKIYLNDGTGHFLAPIPQSLSQNANNWTLGDFNGDGNLDVVAWTFSTASYEVFFGDGSGSFSTSVTVTFSSNGSIPEAADFNGDGVTDLAALVSGGNSVAVAIANGDRTFQTPIYYPAATSATLTVLTSGDIDGDGDRDLVAAGGPSGSNTDRTVMLNNGNGTFTSQTFTVPGQPSISRAILGDINSDSKLDLIYTRSNQIVVSIGNGDGTFQAEQSAPGLGGNGRLFFDDFTGDGIKDIACASTSAASFTVDPVDATGRLGLKQLNIDDNFFTTSVVSADLNEDGKPDIVWGNETVNMKIAFGDGNNGIASVSTLVAPKVPRAVLTADMNHDGHQDIVIIGQNTGEFSGIAAVAYGNGNGTFQSFVTMTGASSQGPVHPLIADLNGDNFPDLILKDTSSRVAITQNMGNGLFAFRGTIDLGGGNIGAMTAGDFDGNGLTDLALLSGGVNIFLNRGNWAWDAAGFFPAGNANANIATADFNNDGQLDLAAVVTSGTGSAPPPGKVEVLFGVGKGGFSAAREFPIGFVPYSMATADFDGDGNTDIAISNTGGGPNTETRVAVLYSDGGGDFPRVNFSQAGTQPRDLMAIDMNSDGRKDLAVVDYNAALLTVLTNECLPAPTGNFPVVTAGPDMSITEGDSGDVTANSTVTLSAPSTVAVRVKYYTAPQVGIVSLTNNDLVEARGSADYLPVSGELVFLPGQTSKTIPLTVHPDLIDEYDENFNLFLVNASNATIGDGRTLVTIVDNDAPPTVSIGNVSAPEGNSGITPLAMTVSLGSVSGKPVTVGYQMGGGTASPNIDYLRSQGTVTIPAGQLSVQLPLSVYGDQTYEPDETFFVDLIDPVNSTIGNGRGTATIQNDDVAGTVQFTGSAFSTPETGSGFGVGITRSGGTAGGVSVRFRTQAGTAQPGQDYTETTTTVVFGDGVTSQSVFIPITQDQLDEPDETINLVLDSPSGVTLGNPSTAVLTILGTNNLPNLSISDVNMAEGDTGISYMQFFLRLSRPIQRQVSVNYSTADGTATAGVDYASSSGTAVMEPGMTRKIISIPIYGDFLPETDETLFVNLSNAVNAVLTDNQGMGRILNDEISTSSTVRLLSIDPANAAGGNNDSYDPYVSRNGKVAAFESYAGNLSPLDNNGLKDIYARNLETNTTSLVSVNRFGTAPGNLGAVKPVISGDGRFVAFSSASADLVPEGVNAAGSAFIRDLQTNTTKLVSTNNAGNPAAGEVIAISGDGRYVVFQSQDQDITNIPDTQNFMDIFVRDTQLNVTKLVSVNLAGNGTGNSDSGNVSTLNRYVSMSNDGRYILFPSTATNLVSQTSTGFTNLFVRDLQTQTTSAVSVNNAGTALIGCSPLGSISDDGRYAVFTASDSNLVPNDTNGVSDVFRRDMQTGAVVMISVNAAGTNGGNAQSSSGTGSADGRYVVFASDASNLTNLSISNVTQMYWRDVTNGVTKMASVNGGNTAGGDGVSSNPKMSADGSTVIFTSVSDDLVPGVDRNSLADIYERDMFTNTTKVVSENQGGTASGNLGATGGSVSGDGNVIGFTSSSSDIVPIDTNGFGADSYAFIKNLPPAPIADFDGDGKTDFSVFRSSSAVWYVLNSSDGGFRAQSFGLSTDVAVPKDYDGDGKTDVAVFRAGVWYVFNSRTSTVSVTTFGQAGDIPVPGDYDGDLRADLAVYHQGTWQVRESSDGNIMTQQFGLATDVPTNADYDGDRRDDLAVFRDGVWYILQSSDFAVRINQFGSPGDKPIQGDFDGDQKTDLAVFRPSIGAWYIAYSATNTVLGTQFGISTDVPLHADFDGDRKADIAIFRDGTWYVTRSSDNSIIVGQFGISGDTALPR